MAERSEAEVIITSATVRARARRGADAQISLFDEDIDSLADVLHADLAGLPHAISYRSTNELLLILRGRRFQSDDAAFVAAEALVAAYRLDAAEPEIYFAAMPVDKSDNFEGAWLVPDCWEGPEPALANRKRWTIDALRLPQCWAHAASRGRPSRGEGIVIAQPDTGIVKHSELAGVTMVSPLNLLDGKPNDPTDPLGKVGNPGHGTGTASVVISPESLDIVGSAPAATLMPIRAIESVVLLSQTKVAQAIDHAVNNGAHVITLSLGGLASLSLWHALERAVDSGVIVMAAAGNCVTTVVWPARYENCIAVAGVDSGDRRWKGSCYGPEVDFSAPAQNVYCATPPGNGVGQSQGTSYAVALSAGVAACWIAYHGRGNVVAAAKARGETVQQMFVRMAKATARVPVDGWDAYNMGAGVLDAEALIKADFDRGLGTESPTDPVRPATPVNSVKSMALARAGAKVLASPVKWDRHCAQISLALLRDGKLPKPSPLPVEESAGVAATPNVRPSRTTTPAFRKFQRQKALIAARAPMEAGSSLEIAASNESQSAEPLTRQAAEATLERVMALADQMPEREIVDRAAFISALNLLNAHGGSALRKLVGEDLSSTGAGTPNDHATLEAIVIADGSRPSFLIENDLPPQKHPFIGNWTLELEDARPLIAPLCAAIGRIQPEMGNAGLFIGTGSLVDVAKGIVLTNYHVIDDARSKFGVLMEEKGSVIKVHGWLEIDFVGEASRFDTKRFRIVEIYLPNGAARGFSGLDAVSMRIEPIGDAVLPKQAVTFDSDMTVLRRVEGGSVLHTIGFPGPPRKVQGPKGEIDWAFVIKTLFGDLFGYKRIAPGRMLDHVGQVPHDRLGIAFGHEATTFGGASGSPLIGWRDDAVTGFGLHFSGINETSNYAIAMARVASELRAVGVPVA